MKTDKEKTSWKKYLICVLAVCVSLTFFVAALVSASKELHYSYQRVRVFPELSVSQKQEIEEFSLCDFKEELTETFLSQNKLTINQLKTFQLEIDLIFIEIELMKTKVIVTHSYQYETLIKALQILQEGLGLLITEIELTEEIELLHLSIRELKRES